jgi:hypothetical protein
MKTRASHGIALFVLAALGAFAAPGHAEWAIDLFGGASWTKSADVDVSGRDNTGLSVSATLSDLEVDTGFTVGARVGYWFESLPFLGLGLDTFFFSIPIPKQTVASTSTFSGSLFDESITFTPSGDARIPDVYLPAGAFSPQLMLRWPLFVSEDAPKGDCSPTWAAVPRGPSHGTPTSQPSSWAGWFAAASPSRSSGTSRSSPSTGIRFFRGSR